MAGKTLLLLAVFLCTNFLSATDEKKKEEEKGEPLREYVVVTATAVKETEKDVVGSFSLVRRQDIEHWKMVNLNEVLDFAGPELSLVGGSYGQISSTFIRGASSTQTLFMINNVRINDPASLSLNVSLLSPQVFEQVEIIDGPQSSLYGSDAMGGVVNLIPQQQPGMRASLWGGSAATLSSTFTYGGKFNENGKFNLGYSYFRTDGIQENSDFLTHNIFGGLNLRSGQMELKPFFFYAHSGNGIPLNMGLPSLERRTKTSSLVGGIPLQVRFSDRVSLEATLGYVTRDYTLRDPQDQWNSFYHTFSRSLQAQGRLIWSGWRIDSPTILGAEVTGAWIDDESVSGKTFDNLSIYSYAFWLEQIIRVKNLQAVLALRSDKFSRFSAHISPRLSLNYGRSLGRFYAGIYAIANAGFRTPKPSEYGSPWGNPALVPEKSFSLEGGFQAAMHQLSLKVGYFDTRFRDMVVFDYQTYRLENSERDRIRGWQVQPELALSHISLSGSFMKLQAVNQDTGERLVRRPDFVVKLTLQGDWRKWYAGVLGRYVGKRKDYDEKSSQVVDSESFTVFSLTAGYKLTSRINLFVKGQNVLDHQYMEIFGYPAPGRLWYFGFDFHW